MPRFLGIGFHVLQRSSTPHQHDVWEVGIYMSGSGTAFIGDQPVLFAPGTIICYPPGIPHWERSEQPFSGYFMGVERLRAGRDRVPVLADGEGGTISRLAALLLEERQLQHPRWETAAQLLFDALIFQLERGRSTPPRHPLVERLQRELIAGIPDPRFSVGVAMARQPMSRNHLRELFARDTGRSPVRFLLELRIEHAKRLLRQGLTVKEAAAQVGIPDAYYFSRRFSREVGMAPTTWAGRRRYER
jgi:AraC-like DNA-binding protein